jgi:DNA processing protein
MGEWRADVMRYPTPRVPSSTNVQRTRGPRYTPPSAETVRTLQLVDVLPPWRSLSEKAQVRLGGAAETWEPGRAQLWCSGDVALLQRTCVAVVGTREVSDDGARRARRLGRELAEAGVVVVSGLARGVDTHALTAAIEAGGKVVAVIGTPLEQGSPAANRPLQERIYREHLLISPFAPGSAVYPGNFPERNKVMAAASDATVIVEASDTSGALHQAKECATLGRWLFICRSVTNDPAVKWPRAFLNDQTVRASVLTETRQILETLAPIR